MNSRYMLPSTVFALLTIANCDVTEPELELPVAHIRVCFSPSKGEQGDCRGDGYWGNERAATRNGAVPIPGVRVRICYWDAFEQCHNREETHFKTGATDSEGYVVFPALDSAIYLFLPDVEEVDFDSCTLVPKDEYGGALRVEPRVASTPVEFQNGHIGELWFIVQSCSEGGGTE